MLTLFPYSCAFKVFLQQSHLVWSFLVRSALKESQATASVSPKCHWALIFLSVILIWMRTWLLHADKAFKRHRAPIVKTLKPTWALLLKWAEGCSVFWCAIRTFPAPAILLYEIASCFDKLFPNPAQFHNIISNCRLHWLHLKHMKNE